MSLASNIRKYRRAADLNQTQLGAQLGVKQGAVSKWESGDSEPDASDLPRIAVAVNVPLDELLQGVDSQYDDWRDLAWQGRKVQRTPHQPGGESDGTQHADRADREVRELREQIESYKRVLGQVEDAASTLATIIAASHQIGTAGTAEPKTRRRHRKAG